MEEYCDHTISCIVFKGTVVDLFFFFLWPNILSDF